MKSADSFCVNEKKKFGPFSVEPEPDDILVLSTMGALFMMNLGQSSVFPESFSSSYRPNMGLNQYV